MNSEQIRKKINSTKFGKSTLDSFERIVGEIEFLKNGAGYFCMPKGAEGFSEEMLNQISARTIDELVMFLYGAYTYPVLIRKPDLIPKTKNEDTVVNFTEEEK